MDVMLVLASASLAYSPTGSGAATPSPELSNTPFSKVRGEEPFLRAGGGGGEGTLRSLFLRCPGGEVLGGINGEPPGNFPKLGF